jgi:thiol-disulfide isomerase/thioredoxin
VKIISKTQKVSIIAIVLVLFLKLVISPIHASNSEVNIYLFYGNGCSYCEKERKFLNQVKTNYGESIYVYEFEIYYNFENAELFNEVSKKLNIDVRGVPFLVVGDQPIIGYNSNETTGKSILEVVNKCLSNGCTDSVKSILLKEDYSSQEEMILGEKNTGDNVSESDSVPDSVSTDYLIDNGKNNSIILNVPLLGDVDLKKISLPFATILIAFMDGFNPCAMWILIFLITMLINMKDRKKLYTLGSVFIVTSALIYFVFLAAWFNFFKFIGYVYWIKVVIGIIAIVSGIAHLKSALLSKGECHVVNKEKRGSIMNKIKSIVKEKQFSLALFGIITLAISVNLIEVVCSAGLPSIYTNLLSTINLSTSHYYLYLLLYIIIFMLDDLFIFFIAIKTFQITGITSKYTKLSSIVGGVVIFVLGILLIFKPELLMFG